MITSVIEEAKQQIISSEKVINLYTERLETEKDPYERAQLTAMIEMNKLDIMNAQNHIKRLQNITHEQAIVEAYKLVKNNISEQIAIAEQGQHAYTHLAAMWLAACGMNKNDAQAKAEYDLAVADVERWASNVEYLKKTLLRVDVIETAHYPNTVKKGE